LVREIDQKYWELGRVLYEVYSGIPGGYMTLTKGAGARKARVAIFEKWGYKNFGEYCEKEIKIKKRTAENLRAAYYYFAVQQQLPENAIEQLITIGRAKVYLLTGVATKSNLGFWIKRAKNLSFEDLKKVVYSSKTDKPLKTTRPRRSLRVDICALVKHFGPLEPFLARHGKRYPAEIQAIMKWYQDQMNIPVPVRLVA
jgi:hypothetical protein